MEQLSRTKTWMLRESRYCSEQLARSMHSVGHAIDASRRREMEAGVVLPLIAPPSVAATSNGRPLNRCPCLK
jgi:hypothetical protein